MSFIDLPVLQPPPVLKPPSSLVVRYGQHPFQPIYTGPSFVTKANAAQVERLYKDTGIPLFKGGYPQ